MMELIKDITAAKFGRFNRVVFAVAQYDTKGALVTMHHYVTKESAYKRLEFVANGLKGWNSLSSVDLDDLDARPHRVTAADGSRTDILTFSIDY